MTQLFIINGAEITPRQSGGMWRADLQGIHYCSPTFEGLVHALQHCHSVEVRHPQPPAPPTDPIVELCAQFIRSGLQEKQQLLRDLRAAAEHDTLAATVVRSLDNKPLPSRYALDFTRRLGRKDFLDVTYDEIVQFAPNIVVRNKLINELAERLSF